MRLSVLQDPDDFAARVGDFLGAHEAEHSLLFGILANLSDGWKYGGESGAGPVLALVDDGDGVAAVAVCTPPRNLVLSRARTVGAVGALATGLRGMGLVLPGVSGPAAEAKVFAEVWAGLHGLGCRRAVAMEVHRASAIRMPDPPAPGSLRPGRESDAGLIGEWIADFNDEALPSRGGSPTDRGEAMALAHDLVAHRGRSVYLWVDGGPVSMAATGRPAPHGGRIYAVYTPPEHRRRGYASSSVATLSASILAGGNPFCYLFTDLANPTSNHIYREIGYEPVAPFDDYRFES